MEREKFDEFEEKNEYEKWRDEKAAELKEIPDHDERNQAWRKHQEDEVDFLYNLVVSGPARKYDKLKDKNTTN